MFLTDAGSSRRFPAFWKRSSISALILAPFLSSSAFAQTVVPITSEPDHHLVISNDFVRVFQVEVPPKAETLYHQHDYDYLYVAIGDADVASTRLHEKPVQVKLKDGEVEFSKGPFAHKATNNSQRPFRNVTIEILGGVRDPICGVAGGEKSCGGVGGGVGVGGGALGEAIASLTVRARSYVSLGGWSYGASFLLHSSKLAVAEVDFKGKATLSLAQLMHGPYLMVPLSRLELTSSSQNGTHALAARIGEPIWIGEKDITLASSTETAKFILVGFSPAKTQ